jgi:hypothetical protein
MEIAFIIKLNFLAVSYFAGRIDLFRIFLSSAMDPGLFWLVPGPEEKIEKWGGGPKFFPLRNFLDKQKKVAKRELSNSKFLLRKEGGGCR